MNSPEYEEILTSLQAVVHRAYALGRSDALKKVLAVMQADDAPLKPLALMGPAPSSQPHNGGKSADFNAAHKTSQAEQEEARPAWWARRPQPAFTTPVKEPESTKH